MSDEIPSEYIINTSCKIRQIASALHKREDVIWISRFPFRHDYEFLTFTSVLAQIYTLRDTSGRVINIHNINNNWYWIDRGYNLYFKKKPRQQQ